VADKAPLGSAPANIDGLGTRRVVIRVPIDDAPPAVAASITAPPAADLILALEQLKKEMQTMFVHQLQEVQNQWQTNFDQLRQAAPEVVPAPLQSAHPQMSIPTFSPNYPYQGFNNNFYPPWLTHIMAANPFAQLSPSYPPNATAGQGGSKA
jgi:hypothetical protein